MKNVSYLHSNLPVSRSNYRGLLSVSYFILLMISLLLSNRGFSHLTPFLPPPDNKEEQEVQLLAEPESPSKAKLVIVIDDIGHAKRDLAVIELPVTIAILPNSPFAKERALYAHEYHREILIHQPMLAIKGRFTESDTLWPGMSTEAIKEILEQSIQNVPHAVGINNHTGSQMTADLEAMQHFFAALNHFSLFFLDSLTTGKSQVLRAAQQQNFQHPIFSRDVFLDNEQDEVAIERQLNEAIRLARKNGQAIAIGHPHQSTINVLKKKLGQLPEDIELSTLKDLEPKN